MAQHCANFGPTPGPWHTVPSRHSHHSFTYSRPASYPQHFFAFYFHDSATVGSCADQAMIFLITWSIPMNRTAPCQECNSWQTNVPTTTRTPVVFIAE